MKEYRDFGVVSIKPEDSIDEHILRLPNPSSLASENGNEVVISGLLCAGH